MFVAARIAALALFAAFSLGVAQADVLIGSKRSDVIQELGKPFTAARRGTHEILTYPNRVRFELENDIVVDLKGYVPPGAGQSPAPAPAPAKTAASITKHSTPIPAPTAPPTATVAASTSTPSPKALSTPETVQTPEPEDRESEPEDSRSTERSLGLSVGVAVAMLAAQFALTFAALKIAFHYHQMDALWSGILSITAIDVVLQTAFAVVLYFRTGEVELGIAGTGLPGLAMLWSIRHFCLDQRWSRACATASAVKTASIALNLGLLALFARFGL